MRPADAALQGKVVAVKPENLNRLHERHRRQLAHRQAEAESGRQGYLNETKAVEHGICTWDGQAHPICGVRSSCTEGGGCPHLIAYPKETEFWVEIETGEQFLVRNVDTWKSGKITVHCINVPSMRMYTGPLSQFMKSFKPLIKGDL